MSKLLHITSLHYLLLLVALCGANASAQQSKDNAVKLEVFYLISQNQPPEFYHLTLDGEYERLKISKRGRGRVNLVPPGDNVTFYRKAIVDEKEVMQPAATFAMPSGASGVLLFFYLDEDAKIQYTVMADSPEIHQGGQVRLINFTEQDVACLVNEERVKLSPGKQYIENVLSDDKRFSFAFAMLEPKPFKSPVKTLPMRTPEHRLIIVFSYLKKPVFNNEGEIESYVLVPETTRLFDRLKNEG